MLCAPLQAEWSNVVLLQVFRRVKGGVSFIVNKCFNVLVIIDGIILYSMIVFGGPFEYIVIIFVLGPTTSWYCLKGSMMHFDCSSRHSSGSH